VLDDGTHAITAVHSYGTYQIKSGNRQDSVDVDSELTPALQIQVDASAPQFQSTPNPNAAENWEYGYNVKTDHESQGKPVAYRLAAAPAGMVIEETTGQISWVPQQGQGPVEHVVVQATDPAGNLTEQAFDIQVTVGPRVTQIASPLWWVADGDRHAFIMTRTGRLTVEATFSHALGNVDLILLNDAGQEVGRSATTNDNERIDVNVGAEEVYRVVVSGSNPAVTFFLTNLLADDGNQLTVYDTHGDDKFEAFAGTSSHRVVINGVPYDDIDAGVTRTIVFMSSAGEDEAIVTGSDLDDTAVLRPRGGEVVGPNDQYQIQLSGVPSISVDGGGGRDVARLIDSDGNDQFVASPAEGALSGSGFANRVRNFDGVHAYAGAGGIDVARLSDSPYDDKFYAVPEYGALFGPGFYNRALGFTGVHAYAGSGGADTAELYDSPGSDRLAAGYADAALYGDGFYNRAVSFGAVQAYASGSSGEPDVADLYDSPGEDLFVARPGFGSMSGPGFLVEAHAFNTVRGHADPEERLEDNAELYGVAGNNDNFFGSPGFGRLFAGESDNSAENFEVLQVFGSVDDVDEARLSDSPGNDTLVATPDFATLSGSGGRYTVSVKQFAGVHCSATRGGVDKADLYDSSSADTFHATPDAAALFGPGFYNRAVSFEEVNGIANTGGDDEARFYDSPSNDTFEFDAATKTGTMYDSQSYTNRAVGFPKVFAFGDQGGATDNVIFYDSPGDDEFIAMPSYAWMHGDGFSAETFAFPKISGHSDAGGMDIARLSDSSGDDLLEASPHEVLLWLRATAEFGSIMAMNFEATHTYATAGGIDTAMLYGSPGDDTFYATPDGAALFGDDFYNRAVSFGTVRAYGRGSSDASDVADLYDSSGEDLFVARPGFGSMSSPEFLIEAHDFDTVRGHADPGGLEEDQAELHGSAGDDDDFWGSPGSGVLVAGDSHNSAEDFEVLEVFGSADDIDEARLTDSPGDDTFVATPEFGTLVDETGRYRVRVEQFAGVHCFATQGGVDKADLFDSSDADTFHATPEAAALFGPGFYNRAVSFEEVTATANAGGDDVAKLYDSPNNDTFEFDGETNTGTMDGMVDGQVYKNQAVGFPQVLAYSYEAGELDNAIFRDSPGDDEFVAAPSYGRMSGDGFSAEAFAFTRIVGISEAGGVDQAQLDDSPENDYLEALPDEVHFWLGNNADLGMIMAMDFEEIYVDAGQGETDEDEATLHASPDPDVLEADGNWAQLSYADAVDVVIKVTDFDKVTAITSTDEDQAISGSETFELELLGPWQQ